MPKTYSIGDWVMFLGFKVMIRRVAFFSGKVEYWILMPDRKNSFAWVSEDRISEKPL